jgi:pSer/pThr/pTyr-binding forkhead associated (FHA) protein
VITLNLLHSAPAQPIQTWKFTTKSIIRIGRAADNDVVISSPTVSRYHVEIHRQPKQWQVVNISDNGTYIDQQPVSTEVLVNGAVIQLAANGAKLQILLDQA